MSEHYTITDRETYRRMRALIDAYNAWVGKRTCIDPAEVPAHLTGLTNADRSAVEHYEFMRDCPVSYFLYVAPERGEVTTWTGQKLGTILSLGNAWRDNFGSKRRHLVFHGLNGGHYRGTYFCGTGDYARVRLSARKG